MTQACRYRVHSGTLLVWDTAFDVSSLPTHQTDTTMAARGGGGITKKKETKKNAAVSGGPESCKVTRT